MLCIHLQTYYEMYSALYHLLNIPSFYISVTRDRIIEHSVSVMIFSYWIFQMQICPSLC